PRTVLVTQPPVPPSTPSRPPARPTVQAPPPPPSEPPTVLAPPKPEPATVLAPTPSTPSEISIAVGPPVEEKRRPVGLGVAWILAFLVLGVAAAYLAYRLWPSSGLEDTTRWTDTQVKPSAPTTTSQETSTPGSVETTKTQAAGKTESPPTEDPKTAGSTDRGTTPTGTEGKTTHQEHAAEGAQAVPEALPRGTLFINFLPWAEILSIKRVSDGFRVPLATPAYTPLWVPDVPAGRYVVEYRHPAMSASATVEIDVVGQQINRLVQRVFPKGLPPELQGIWEL
ncbi:MAG: hypothetical protein NZ742_06790, partial [Acidobacteria bacterium]|nr:hypothetical protein [Acidobacteriota bacterium]